MIRTHRKCFLFGLALGLVFAFIGGGCSKSKQNLVLNAQSLAAIPDDKLESAILEYVASKIGDDFRHEHEIVTSLPKGVQAIYITVVLEGEVDNGGFNQYFWNTEGMFRNEVVAAFNAIGATKHAAVANDACMTYDSIKDKLSKLQEKGTKQAFSDSYKDNPLSQYDDKFYKLEENLTSLRIKLIRNHPELF